MKGFVKIPRRLFATKWWHQKRTYSEADAIIDLYQSADKDGCFTFTVRTLADRWLWPSTTVYRFIASLAKEGYIEVVKSATSTAVRIIDFGTVGTPSGTPNGTPKPPKTKASSDVGGTPFGTPSGTPRAYKNDNIISCLKQDNIRTPYNPPRGYEKFDFSFVDGEFIEVLFEWLRYKSERGDKKYVQRGIEALYKRIINLSSSDVAKARLIINQSIANNYTGIFELKEKDTSPTQLHNNSDENKFKEGFW